MTFDFSDFEAETVGSIPSGWSLEVSNPNNAPSPYTRVIDGGSVIEGDKSFLIGDAAGGGIERVSHPISDEDIRFVGEFNRGITPLPAGQGAVTMYSPPNWWFRARTKSDSLNDPFEMWYGTGSPPNNGLSQSEISAAADAQLQNLSAGYHRVEFVDTTSSLKLRIDDSLFFDSGDSFSGQTEFKIESDDLIIVSDTPNKLYSSFVYKDGAAIRVNAGSQTFVKEVAPGENPTLVSETADSGYAKIEGSPIESQ